MSSFYRFFSKLFSTDRLFVKSFDKFFDSRIETSRKLIDFFDFSSILLDRPARRRQEPHDRDRIGRIVQIYSGLTGGAAFDRCNLLHQRCPQDLPAGYPQDTRRINPQARKCRTRDRTDSNIRHRGIYRDRDRT